MSKVVMTCAAIVLAVGYLLSAVIRAYVGAVRMRIRRLYWASVVPCLMLSASQVWLLLISNVRNDLAGGIIFGQTAAGLALPFVFILPALEILRRPESWSGR